MGKRVKFTHHSVEPMQTPKQGYTHTVTIVYGEHGKRIINVKSLDDVNETLEKNASIYVPTVEEVTCNGRYSCD